MLVYHSDKKGFVNDVFNGTIADDIDNAFLTHLGRHTSPNEKLSWKNSMMHMYKVINTNDIPDSAGVSIEYQIPLTSKRVDFMISGLDNNNRPNVVIVELKQWESAELSEKSGLVKTWFQHGEQETAHPSYQAWSYAYMLENYNATICDKHIALFPCAFLHNYSQDSVITNPVYEEYIDKAPVFLKSDAAKLQNFIKTHIRFGSKEDIVWMIENGNLRPSKQLADSLVSMLKGNKEFMLLDEQKVVYETAISLARSANRAKKQVLIVEGGPGTGKSVIAVNLLVELTREGIVSQYVSKNAAPRDVYTAKLTGSFRKNYINNLFVGSGSFVDCQDDLFGALIVDEAHRLNMKSGHYGNLGENQVKEIIQASKFTIFFVDDRQRVHIRDIGSVKSIQKYAEECGAVVTHSKLSSQFRCNGSDGYLSWLENTLQIRDTANINLSPEDFDFKVFDNPNDLFDVIFRKNKVNNKARLVAGYCWDWNSKRDPSQYDIIIPEFDFKKQWNLSSDHNLWILSEDSVNEIGCIHTCQGLELDYVGVIIGPDMRFEDGRVITDVTCRSRNDQSVKGFKSMMKENREQTLQEAEEIIKNTYRTLMTRGMKGCYIYCCDKALSNYIKSCLAPSVKSSSVPSVKSYFVPSVKTCSVPSFNEEVKELRLESDVNDEVKYVDFLPVYSMKAACGYFGDGEVVEVSGWMEVTSMGRLNRNMFIVQASGHSMEPIIHDGDYCVFRANPAGSRQGKIVLVEHNDYYDSDYSGSYSIKTYTSKKSYDDLGNWQHEKIILQPKNKDFNAIVLSPEDIDEFRIVAEYIGTLSVD